jgi:hypothetical protein
MEGRGRGSSEYTIPAFMCDWIKQQKSPVRIASMPVEIRAKYLPNTKLVTVLQLHTLFGEGESEYKVRKH